METQGSSKPEGVGEESSRKSMAIEINPINMLIMGVVFVILHIACEIGEGIGNRHSLTVNWSGYHPMISTGESSSSWQNFEMGVRSDGVVVCRLWKEKKWT